MDLTNLLKGKMVNYMTDAKVNVKLEIETAIEKNHTRDLEPATRENDWYPKTEGWSTIEIKFTTGFIKSYRSLTSIELIE
jgi:hypothetical protein